MVQQTTWIGVPALGLLAGLLVGSASAAEPAAPPRVVEPKYVPVFEDSFRRPASEILGAFTQNYKMVEPGGYELGPGGLTLSAEKARGVTLVRPARTGSVARLRVGFDFPALGEKSASAETGLGFVLSNAQELYATFGRKQGEKSVSISFSQRGPAGARDLRVVSLESGAANGTYEVLYHHGLLRVEHDGKVLAQGYAAMNPNTSTVVGVVLRQQSAPVKLLEVSLRGEVLPMVDAQADAVRAARVATEKAGQLYRAEKWDEAHAAAKESLAAWVKARGEGSRDAANALENLAAIEQKRKNGKEAAAAYSVVVASREKLLGTGHPLTASTRLGLALALLEDGQREAARHALTSVVATFTEVHGERDPTVLSARTLLESLGAGK